MNAYPSEAHIFDDSSESDNFANIFHSSGSSEAYIHETEPSSLLPDIENPHFSDVYSTPGPGYYVSHPIHFDSPVEDPLSLSRLGVLGDELDFKWETFDRKHIVAPTLLRGTTKSEPVYDIYEVVPEALKQSDNPISPSPFRFSPLDENEMNSRLPDKPVPHVNIQQAQHVPLLPACNIFAPKRGDLSPSVTPNQKIIVCVIFLVYC